MVGGSLLFWLLGFLIVGLVALLLGRSLCYNQALCASEIAFMDGTVTAGFSHLNNCLYGWHRARRGFFLILKIAFMDGVVTVFFCI